MQIRGVVARRRVDDLDAAVGFYEQLTGESARRFAFSGADLAAVGPFLLFSATGLTGDRLAGVVATVVVDDLADCAEVLVRSGAEIVAPATPTPTGNRLIARHPDGAVFEYVGP